MKISIKKIIAREFLILIVVVVCGSLCFLCTYPYNYHIKKEIEKLNTKISRKTILKDSLKATYFEKQEKQDWYLNNFINEFSIYKSRTSEKLWKRTQILTNNDSIKILWENTWSKDKQIISFFNKIGFSNPIELQNFIKDNSFLKLEKINKNQTISLEKEIQNLNNSKIDKIHKVLSYNKQIEFLKNSVCLLFIILFGLRYIFYASKWSLKTLKEEK